MVRKREVVLLAGLVVLFLIVAAWPILSYKIKSPSGSITGNSIKEVIGDFYETSSVNKRIFILSQIILFIVVIAAIFLIVSKFRTHVVLKKNDFMVSDGSKRSHTDLDILYQMLKKKGEINMQDIESAFNINSDIALGWSKILESGDLAELDYPRFGKPVLRLLTEQEKTKEKIKNGEGIVEEIIEEEKVVPCDKSLEAKKISSTISPEKKIATKKISAKRKVSRKTSKKKVKKKRITKGVSKKIRKK